MNRKKIKQEEEDIVIGIVSIIDRLFCDDVIVIVFYFYFMFWGMYVWVCYIGCYYYGFFISDTTINSTPAPATHRLSTLTLPICKLIPQNARLLRRNITNQFRPHIPTLALPHLNPQIIMNKRCRIKSFITKLYFLFI